MPSQPNVSKAALTLALAAGLVAGCETGNKPGPTPIRPTPDPTPAQPNNKVPPTTQQQSFVPFKPADPTIVTVGNTRVTRSELEGPLMEAYGFNLLMLIVQRDMARDACNEQKLIVTPDDLRKEFDFALQTLFQKAPAEEDRERLLEQYLAQPKQRDQMLTRTEFDIVIETNAYMRKLVAKNANKAVTDEMLQQQFDEEYGAQVQIRSIVVDNPQDAARVRARLDAGEDFATVARQESRDPTTKRLGGERPPFGLASVGYPENFKRVAFNLKPGEVSDPVSAGGGYHLIKLERKISPKAVKFDDVKASLREDVEAKATLELVKRLRGALAQQALAQMAITEPTLKAEFDKRMSARDTTIRDQKKIKEQMEKDRVKAAAPTTTKPATAPAPAPTVAPTPTPAAGPAPAVVPTPTPAPATQPEAAPPQPKPATTTPTATEPVAPPADATSRPTPPPVAPVTPPAPATKPTPPPAPVAPAPEAGKSPAVPTNPTTGQAESEKKAQAPAVQTVDPITGAIIPADRNNVRTGVAPIGVIQNHTGFSKPEPSPTTAPAAASRPTTQP